MIDAAMVVIGFAVFLAVLAQLMRGGLLRLIATVLFHVALRFDAADKVRIDLLPSFRIAMWRGVCEMGYYYRSLVRQYTGEMRESRNG